MWAFLFVVALCIGLAATQVWKWVRKSWHVQVAGLRGQLHWPRSVAPACADLPVYAQWLWWASQCMSWKIGRVSCTVGTWTVAGTEVTIGSAGDGRDMSGVPAILTCCVEHCVLQSGPRQWHISGAEIRLMRGRWSLPWLAIDTIRYVPGQSSSPARDTPAAPMARLAELLSKVKLWERRAQRVRGAQVSIAELTWPKGTVRGIRLQAHDLEHGVRYASCEQAVWHTSGQGTQFALANATLVQGSAGTGAPLAAVQVRGINMLVRGRTRVACDVLDAVLSGTLHRLYLHGSAVQVSAPQATASVPAVFIATELQGAAPHVPVHAHIPALLAQVLARSAAAQGCTIRAMLPRSSSASGFIQHADVDKLSVQLAAAAVRTPTQQPAAPPSAKASRRPTSATQWLQRVHSVTIRRLAVQCRDAMALAVAHGICAQPARSTASCEIVRLCATQHAAVVAAATGISCTLLLNTGCTLPQCEQLRHVQATCSALVIHSLPRVSHMWASFKQAATQPKRAQRTVAARAAAKLWTLTWQVQLLVVKHRRAQLVASALSGDTFATSAPKFTAANLPARLENYLHRAPLRATAARQLVPALRRLRQGLWLSLSSWQLSVHAKCEAVAGANPAAVPGARADWHVWLSDVQAHTAAALAASTVHAWASVHIGKPERAARTDPAVAESSWRRRLAQAASKLPGPVRVLNVRAGCALRDEEGHASVDARVAVKAARLSADLAVHWQAVDARVQGAAAAGKTRVPSRATLPSGSIRASSGPTFQVHLPAGPLGAAVSIEWALIDQLLAMAKRASSRSARATPASDKQATAHAQAWDVRLCVDVRTSVQLELANGTRLVNQFATARARHVRCGAALAGAWSTFWAVSTHDGALLANERLVGSTAAVHFASSSLAGAALVASSHLDRFLRGGPVAGEQAHPASSSQSPASSSASSDLPGEDAEHGSNDDDAYTMPSSGSDTEYEEPLPSSPRPTTPAPVSSPALAPVPVSASGSGGCPAYIIHDARVIWSPHAIQAVLECVAALHHVRSAWKRRFDVKPAGSPDGSACADHTATAVFEQSASMVLPPVLELPTARSSSPDAWSQSSSSPESRGTPSGFPSAIPRVTIAPGSAAAAAAAASVQAMPASGAGPRQGLGGSSTVQRLLRERGPGPTPRVNAPLPLHIIDDDVPLSPLATTRTVASSVGLSLDDRSHWSDAAAAWLGLDGSASVKSMFSPAGGAAAGERGLPSTPARVPPPQEGSASTATTSKAKSPLTPSTWLNSHAPSARLASAGDFLLKMKATGLQILVIPDGADDDQATLQEVGAYGLLIVQRLRAHVLRKLADEDVDAAPSAKTLELQAVLSQAVLCGATADTVAAALPAAGAPRRLAALFTSWDKAAQPWRARPSQWLSQAGKLSEVQLVWCAVRPPHSAFSAQMGQSRSMSPCSGEDSPGEASGDASGVEDGYDDSSGSEMPLATNRSWLLSIQVPRVRASTHAVLARACAGVIRQAGASARGIKIAWVAALAALRGERQSAQAKPKAAFHIEVLVKTAWLSALEHGSQQARMRMLVRAFSLRGRHSVRGPRRYLRASATIGWAHMWRSVPCSGPSLADQEVARWHSIFGGHVQANALTPADRMVTITAVLDWARAENGADSIRLRHGEVALFPSIPGTVIAEVHRDDVGFIRQFIRDVAHAGPMITHARTPGPAPYDSASSAAAPSTLAAAGATDAEPLFDAAQPMNAASSAFLLGTSLRGASRTMTHKPSKSSTQSGTAAASSHLGLSPGAVPSTPSSALANAEANVRVTLFRVHQLNIQSSLDGWMGVSVRNIFTSLPEFSVRNTRCSMAQLLDDILSHYVGALRKLAPKLLTKAALHRGKLGLPGRTVLGSDAMSAAASRADSSHSTLNSDTPASSSGATRGGESGATARKASRQLAAMAPPPAHVFTGRGGARPLAHQRIGRVLEAAAARRKLQHEGASGLEEGGPGTPEYGPAAEASEATPLHADSAPPEAPVPTHNIAEQFLGMGDKPGQRGKLKRAVKSMLGRK